MVLLKTENVDGNYFQNVFPFNQQMLLLVKCPVTFSKSCNKNMIQNRLDTKSLNNLKFLIDLTRYNFCFEISSVHITKGYYYHETWKYKKLTRQNTNLSVILTTNI